MARKRPEGWRNKKPDDPRRHALSAKGVKTVDKLPRTDIPLGGERERSMWVRMTLIGKYPGYSTRAYVEKMSNLLEDQNYHNENRYLQRALLQWDNKHLRKLYLTYFNVVAKDALKGIRHSRKDIESDIKRLFTYR